MKNLVRRINDLFVQIVLVFFYLLIIGITFLVKRAIEIKRRKLSASSYWEDNTDNLNIADFASSY